MRARTSSCCAELVAQLQLLGLRHFVLSRSVHSCQQGSAARPSSFNSFGSVSTSRADYGTSFARQTTQHQSLYRGSRPLMSFNNSSAVDRVICLFQAHGLSENKMCMNVEDAVYNRLTETWCIRIRFMQVPLQRDMCIFRAREEPRK